jgi:hypothetical protein
VSHAEKKMTSLRPNGPRRSYDSNARRRTAVHLLDAPRHRAVLVDPLLAELGDRRRIVARQPVKGILPVPFPIEIEKVIGIFLIVEAGHLPGVGIDRALDQRGLVLLEEGTDLWRQQTDGPLHDELVSFEAPRVRGGRHRSHRQHAEHQ